MAHLKVPYRKSYAIRRHGLGSSYLQLTIPYKVVEKVAATKGLNLDEFIERYGVIAEYDGSDRIVFTFAEKERTVRRSKL